MKFRFIFFNVVRYVLLCFAYQAVTFRRILTPASMNAHSTHFRYILGLTSVTKLHFVPRIKFSMWRNCVPFTFVLCRPCSRSWGDDMFFWVKRDAEIGTKTVFHCNGMRSFCKESFVVQLSQIVAKNANVLKYWRAHLLRIIHEVREPRHAESGRLPLRPRVVCPLTPL